ncbi:cytochrome c [Ochrobactrum sp. Marseille-Q0166]|uniref:c-type cytochrome n=1 Tax=Ochrobactrum sp. Marseille-Q0166 TaxID=2761105 RepID=UPI001655E5D2|nr:cytochrome c [Ochrobactrum sp. Marseille-Q0166]MBC8719665.1 c-type cytochrome [Ochrobactrum sp. Marseille-Q0166]
MLKSILKTFAALIIVVAAGFGVYAYHGSIPPMPPAERPAFDAATIEHGRTLVAAGYCAECHTAKGGQPFAGNFPIVTAFGTIYGSNITPDPDTGIGKWSPAAFRRALHDGVDADGRYLFPAFPYDHFTKISDQDVDAIYAYIMTQVTPVSEVTKPTDIPFPLNIRFLQAGWSLLFVDRGRYVPDSAKSEEWNRGAYLVDGISHCGACHTPRNLLGAEKSNTKFMGANLDNWTAPAINAESPAGVPWTAADFAQYLKEGSDRFHGVATGPMSPVVHEGIRALPDSDIAAIATYLGDIAGAGEVDPATLQAVNVSIAAGKPDPSYRESLGERLYASTCASCHYNNSASNLKAERPDLGINSATRLDDPANLIRVILDGVPTREGAHGIVMPAYRNALNDEQISVIATYLRASRTHLPAWPDLEARVKDLRAYVGTH